MKIELEQICALLKERSRVLILTHKSPDGDTLGAGFGLYYALKQMGKQAYVANSDGIPDKFKYLAPEQMEFDFEPDLVVSVDIAAPDLLGDKLPEYSERINLCIDHHISNTLNAEASYIDNKASSTCEIMFRIINMLGLVWDKHMADSVYTGISTDTGCFRYSNTTADAHRFAAELIAAGADYERINNDMFITKSRARMDLERLFLDSMEFYFDGRCSMVTIFQEDMDRLGADNSTFDGIPAMTKQIEGVDVGISVREEPKNDYKISIRTSAAVNASLLAQQFGGGGHIRAAGCSMSGPLPSVKEKLLEAVQRSLD